MNRRMAGGLPTDKTAGTKTSQPVSVPVQSYSLTLTLKDSIGPLPPPTVSIKLMTVT